MYRNSNFQNSKRREREGALLNAVLRHLTSVNIEDLSDKGLELFTTLSVRLEEILDVQRQQQEEEARRLHEQQQIQDQTVAQREGRGGPFDHCDQLDDDGNGSPGEQNHDIGDEGQHDDERQVSLVVIPPGLGKITLSLLVVPSHAFG